MRRALSLAILCWTLTALTPTAAETPPPDQTSTHHVAVGIRTYAHDPTALLLTGKLELVDLGTPGLSVRPALLFGQYLEARASLTVELRFIADVTPFTGIGAAYGTDNLGTIDPMLTAGLDVPLHERIALNLTVNYIFQVRVEDDDKEIMGSLGVSF